MTTLVINHAAGKGSSCGHTHEHGPAAPNTAPSKEPVAMPPVTVNGVTISRKEIAAEVQNFPARNPGEGWRAATKALVIRELLLQRARQLETTIDPQADADGRVETDEDAFIRTLIEREVAVPIADDVVLRRFYDKNLARFRSAALYEASHILLGATKTDAAAFSTANEHAKLLSLILAGKPEKFSDLARQWSTCTSAALGGSLGQISPGETTPEFEQALLKLEPGEISSPIETRYGIHLIQLARRIDGRQLPFEAVETRIAEYLDEHVRRQASAQYISLLIGQAEIRGIDLNGASSPLVQ